MVDETTDLLHSNSIDECDGFPHSFEKRNAHVSSTTTLERRSLRSSFIAGIALLGIVVLASAFYKRYMPSSSAVFPRSDESFADLKILGNVNILNSSDASPPPAKNLTGRSFSYGNTVDTPEVRRRCDFVIKQFQAREHGSSHEQLQRRYQEQSIDANVFFRATAHLFWFDFVHGRWISGLTKRLREDSTLRDKAKLDHTSAYTWVTGDQHLSNFGAFQNRHGDVVFSVNDFDEGAIYDFQVDVLRIAVSICNHAVTNGLHHKDVKEVLEEFTDTYVETVISYIGNEDALLFELTTETTTGFLNDFLKKVNSHKSYQKQMEKYTTVDKRTGYRSFQKGPVGRVDPETKLAALPVERFNEIKSAFNATTYGATTMKIGWNVQEWDDDFFTVLDVAARIGSGVGSWGVDRYYVLLKGTDTMLQSLNENDADSDDDGVSVVLDVKYEPPGAVSQVLTDEEKAWYQNLFSNDAARVVEAQRKLTSYTDPYTGWIMLPDDNQRMQPFAVRQRSPWKDSPDLDKLTNPREFSEFVNQIAKATATSHVRGSVGKKPGDFKSVIDALLGKKKKRRHWGKEVAELARSYHEQVLLDYECFSAYAEENYPQNGTP